MLVLSPPTENAAEALEQFAAEEKITGPRADLEDAIGSVQAQMGNWDEARQAFENAIAVDSSYRKARIHLGSSRPAAERSGGVA